MGNPVWQGTVPPDWVDYNGHMNDAAYAAAFSRALDVWMERIGINESFRAEHHYTVFTLETHLLYLAEVHQDDELTICVDLLDRDAKRVHLMFEMKNQKGDLVATSEQMTMGIDQKQGKPAPFPEEIEHRLSALPPLERDYWPRYAGRTIGIKKK
ncbi:acyl-CoA thioester hydrolase [Melghirimyces thermohalophilus]|uniref:Acyl-CoA thioester hydrolase n=1 Tax=Melghirimyces thermohalophilus TaxID=1236220 RepID=A0A1G6KKL1_9BACL|nr:thioesterase family protein [Melghirimyces thermohalophilus]SDC31570.1 acyl-CoA thioester hydrolase [Melghirimyces thermohalophilus]